MQRHTDHCDAVLVLGGGVREGGELPPWVVRRFDRALEVSGSAPIVCLSAATVHRPSPLNAEGYPILESVAGAAHLLARGVPPERIQVEATSYDTIGNAYFSKLLHVDPAHWTNLVVITSEFHMPRSRAIFEWIYGMEPSKYMLQFEAMPNDGLSGPLLQRRRDKEASALSSLQYVMQRIRDLEALHRWMYTEHNAYTAQGWTTRRSSAPELVEIY
jgi:uncharacterized SAM-binding protein YcdF (DUF218 family)